jgi:hypothetical protein
LKCLFCQANSDSARSIEHIVPESLGNKTFILPPGVICDGCNNYFACEVERPFLESPSISLMRFHQLVESTKGRVPPATGIITPGNAAVVRRNPKDGAISVDIPPEAFEHLSKSSEGTLILPIELSPPKGLVVSRFMAKVALEAMAQRLLNDTQRLAFLRGDTQLDLIRYHARRGTTPDWPVHIRRIYDESARWIDEFGEAVQVVHEQDFLMTPESECYFILALFGQEYTINVAGPSIEGYVLWLEKNDHVSPLYHGKNAASRMRPYIEKE